MMASNTNPSNPYNRHGSHTTPPHMHSPQQHQQQQHSSPPSLATQKVPQTDAAAHAQLDAAVLPTASDASSLEDPNISQDDLNTAISVLAKISARFDSVYKHKSLRKLRKAIAPIVIKEKERFFDGKTPHVYRRKQWRKHMSAKQKELDRTVMNSCQLRAGRLQRLSEVRRQALLMGVQDFEGVPDGWVDTHDALSIAPSPVCSKQPLAQPHTEAAANTSHALDEAGGSHGSKSQRKLTFAGHKTHTEDDGTAQSDKGRVLPGALAGDNGVELLYTALKCYVCKCMFRKLHSFYHSLCPECAELNFSKRSQTSDLTGMVAIVTGGRVKVGFQIVKKLLDANCHVVVTTRFPADALSRYKQLPNYSEIKHRLNIYGLDLRALSAVEQFCQWVDSTFSAIDIIVNNACQTVRRPIVYYQHLLGAETAPALKEDQNIIVQTPAHQDAILSLKAKALGTAHESASAASTGDELVPARADSTLPASALSAVMSQIPTTDDDRDPSLVAHFPKGATDVNHQQLDLRKTNSWVLKLGEISTGEAAEVFAINALSPFIINGKLRPILSRSKHERKFIVNVSAMEGKFDRHKSPNHPHTNMAKAALNMMTRTSGQDYAKDGIYMTSVDTGWINDENPLPCAAKRAKVHHFQTPLDEIDAASRVLDPIFLGMDPDTTPFRGVFLKDYDVTSW
eukprot:m.231216 g.231216  ORF g.231216 m.231216 type:complete len:682 (+) comp15216_c0_seq4:201-2246(+)